MERTTMLINIILFVGDALMFRERGWFSPLIGISAIFAWLLLEFLVYGLRYNFSLDPYRIMEGGYPQFVYYSLTIYLVICTLLIYIVISRMAPQVDHHKLPKISRVPYKLLGYITITIALLSVPFLFYDYINKRVYHGINRDTLRGRAIIS